MTRCSISPLVCWYSPLRLQQPAAPRVLLWTADRSSLLRLCLLLSSLRAQQTTLPS
jgi:hypothetical protein